jgi:hypothetical protein
MKKIKQRIYILLAMIISFSLVTFISPKVFLSDTPRINPQALRNIIDIPTNIYLAIQGQGNQKNPKDIELTSEIKKTPHPSGVVYNQIAKGVYASEPNETGNRFIKIEEGTRLEKRDVTLGDGRRVTVYIPLE